MPHDDQNILHIAPATELEEERNHTLLARVESQAQERGARKILLNTYGFQAPGLYRRLGFQEVATIDDVLGTSWHIFLKRI